MDFYHYCFRFYHLGKWIEGSKMLQANTNPWWTCQRWQWGPEQLRTGHPSYTQLLPLRLRDIRDRKNPDAEPAPPGNFRSTSPISWANSVPGKSISLVMLLTTNSVNTSGFSCRSFSTKKSGLKIIGWPRREESLQITKLQMASLKNKNRRFFGGSLLSVLLRSTLCSLAPYLHRQTFPPTRFPLTDPTALGLWSSHPKGLHRMEDASA